MAPGFIFWALTDGTGGRTQTAQALTETVGTSPLTLIAWYYLPPGGGNGGSGGSAVLIDAYSVRQGGFVDDDFVTVTSDGSLTNAANIDGVVPTSVVELVQAHGSIPTGEGFDSWVVSSGGTSAVGDVLSAPKGSGGFAVAIYVRTEIEVHRIRPYMEGSSSFTALSTTLQVWYFLSAEDRRSRWGPGGRSSSDS